jgi:hypothetical protein
MGRLRHLPALLASGIAAVLCSGAALAVQDEDLSFDTTEDLYQVCSVQPGAAEYVAASFACRAFIEAAVQYHDAVVDRRQLKRLICYPATATIADGRAAFVTWAQRNAGNETLMNELPVVGLVRALAAKYPCK